MKNTTGYDDDDDDDSGVFPPFAAIPTYLIRAILGHCFAFTFYFCSAYPVFLILAGRYVDVYVYLCLYGRDD